MVSKYLTDSKLNLYHPPFKFCQQSTQPGFNWLLTWQKSKCLIPTGLASKDTSLIHNFTMKEVQLMSVFQVQNFLNTV